MELRPEIQQLDVVHFNSRIRELMHDEMLTLASI